jgi:transposase-like protein
MVIKESVMSKTRKKYSEEIKRKAVDDFNSGAKNAQQIADELGFKDTSRIYYWKTLYSEESNGRTIPTQSPSGDNNSEMHRRLLELEMENEELKKSLGEKSLIIDLLKKIPGNSVYEKNANGLMKTIKDVAAKKRHLK